MIQKSFSLFLATFVILFFFLCCRGVVLASSVESFLFLKNIANHENKISSLSLQNHNLLIFKAFEYNESQIFSLSRINHDTLLSVMKEEKVFYSKGEAVHLSTQRFSEIDIWDFLERENDRKKGMEEYLFLAKSALSRGQEQSDFLSKNISRLEKKIAGQKNTVKSVEKEFKSLLSSRDRASIDLARANVFSENLLLKEFETEYLEAKSQFDDLLPSVSLLRKKIIAIEENKDAIIKNVKTKKSSGEFIGVIE